MIPIIHDCDPGHDDAIALMLALASPEVELLGVTTVSGNQALEKTTANAIRVLDRLGNTSWRWPPGRRARSCASPLRPPVCTARAGSTAPSCRRRRGRTGEEHAIDWIARTLREHPAPVTLVPTGPLTNIALLLARHPELEARIERVVLMGGAIGEGNVTPGRRVQRVGRSGGGQARVLELIADHDGRARRHPPRAHHPGPRRPPRRRRRRRAAGGRPVRLLRTATTGATTAGTAPRA